VGSKTNQPSPTSSIDGVVKTTPAGPGHETPRRAPPIRRRAVRNGWTRWRDSPRGLVVLLQIDRTPRSGRRDWLRWGDGRGPAGDEMRGRPLAIGSGFPAGMPPNPPRRRRSHVPNAHTSASVQHRRCNWDLAPLPAPYCSAPRSSKLSQLRVRTVGSAPPTVLLHRFQNA
jgi:hypothetical protein